MFTIGIVQKRELKLADMHRSMVWPEQLRRCFSRKFGKQLNESTVRSILMSHNLEVQQKQKREEDDEVKALPVKKRGGSVLLGEALDTKVLLEENWGKWCHCIS